MDTTNGPSRKIVCLCGSMRFEQRMREVAVDESLAGAIVLLPLVNMNHPDPRWSQVADAAAVKDGLDRLHLAKINAADEAIVVAPGGYVGHSTRRELHHALRSFTPVRFLDDRDVPLHLDREDAASFLLTVPGLSDGTHDHRVRAALGDLLYRVRIQPVTTMREANSDESHRTGTGR